MRGLLSFIVRLKRLQKQLDNDEDSGTEKEHKPLDPHCAARDALLKAHSGIVQEDLFSGIASDDDNEGSAVMARLLVPENMVGCLLGKGGDIIQRLQRETGASIRVLPANHLPACAMSTDELVHVM